MTARIELFDTEDGNRDPVFGRLFHLIGQGLEVGSDDGRHPPNGGGGEPASLYPERDPSGTPQATIEKHLGEKTLQAA